MPRKAPLRHHYSDGLHCQMSSRQTVRPTALCIRKLLPLVKYLRNHAQTQQEKEILMRLEVIVRSGAQGLLEEETPTPECRLILAAVLAACGKLFACEDMTKAVLECLKEGIGCNEDGQFDERTSDNANRLNNGYLVGMPSVSYSSAIKSGWFIICIKKSGEEICFSSTIQKI